MKVNVYVPAVGADPSDGITVIAARSGIVGRPTRWEKLVELWFEGNLYGAPALETYPARVRQAAGRMTENYPTIARMIVDREKVVYVGQYDTETDELAIERQDLLDHWLAKGE